MKSCPICGETDGKDLLYYPEIPVFDNVLYQSKNEAKHIIRGAQRVVICPRCGFVFNCEFEPSKVIYDKEYHAERWASHYYRKHIHTVVDWISSHVPIENKHILEVASGNGEFLRSFLKYRPQKCVGVDPSVSTSADNGILFESAFFNDDYLAHKKQSVDILINRHMIEHIQNPLKMLSLFYQALNHDGILYLETPRLNWILENRVFYDFPYEHCSYFSDDFMNNFLKAAGFTPIAIKHTYDGQYFSILARKSRQSSHLHGANLSSLNQIEVGFFKLNAAFQSARKRLAAAGENVWLWGASAKGVMCCNLLGNYISGCIDKNPFKQGKFIPITVTPVIAPDDIPLNGIRRILVENDVYYDEIQEELNGISPNIELGRMNQYLGLTEYPY